MLCVRMTGHGEYRDIVSRVSLGIGIGMERCRCVCTLKVKKCVSKNKIKMMSCTSSLMSDHNIQVGIIKIG